MITHTYAVMEVSYDTYREILIKLIEAGYQHAVHMENIKDQPLLDMHGIALKYDNKKPDLKVDLSKKGEVK